MPLTYGLDSDGALISIADVPRGATSLTCPYCGIGLTAKKGQHVAHHFVHRGTTCPHAAYSTNALRLPMYDDFTLYLSGKELAALTAVRTGGGIDSGMAARLEDRGFLHGKRSKMDGPWKLTKLGKIPVGDLSLLLFCQVQEPAIAQRHDELQYDVANAWHRRYPYIALNHRLTDFRICRAQLRRVLMLNLYFVAITSAGRTFYKIGVTAHPIADRIRELTHDLAPLVDNPQITVLGEWPHRGHVEHYFIHRYADHARQIGPFSEYFQFDDVKPILRDLRRMPARTLTAEEDALVHSNAPAAIERVITEAEAVRAEAHNRAVTRAQKLQGMRHARAARMGRPPGTTEAAAEFLATPTSQRVIAALSKGMSLGQVASYEHVSIRAVHKVKALLDNDPHQE